jgi:hypothetical protein
MASAGPPIVYRRYRAPQNHGETFADPPLGQVPRLVAANIERRRQRPNICGHKSSGDTIGDARRELIQLAIHYTRQYRDVTEFQGATPDVPILMAGHQPQLFHPGVWYKNFALSRLAESLGGTAINVIVDNDAVGHSAIRVPTESLEHPRIENVEYHTPADQIPFEELTIQDRSLFDTFAVRVQQRLEAFVPDPLLKSWWPKAIQSADAVGNLGRSLARARHQLEGTWGLETLELPLSMICETEAFRRWMMHVLMELPRFQAVYNSCLQEYRRVNHVRSRAHPAPELIDDGQWLEAPFWLWTTRRPRRGHLWVRQRTGQLEFSDRMELHFTISFSQADAISSAANSLASLAANGVRIRPRALMTTLYLRLFLCDLFIHGIGGGKYDQLTDAIMQRFFSVAPPYFLVLTATAKLPIAAPAADPQKLRQVEWLLRELIYNPDRHIEDTPQAQPLRAAKQRWLTADARQGARRDRHLRIQKANFDLQPFVARKRNDLLEQRDQLTAAIRNDRLLSARDYAFCLFPKATLQALLLDKR